MPQTAQNMAKTSPARERRLPLAMERRLCRETAPGSLSSGRFIVARGLPQCGQASAKEEILFPHSGQVISAILFGYYLAHKDNTFRGKDMIAILTSPNI